METEWIRMVAEIGAALVLGIGGMRYKKIVELVLVLIDSIEMAHKINPNNTKRIAENRTISKKLDKKLNALLKERGYIHDN